MSADPLTKRGRATAVEDIADIYSRGNIEVNNGIFKDEPFASLFVANDVGLTLGHLHDYAVTIYPLALSELRLAQWYAYQLPSAGTTSKTLSAEVVQKYLAKVKQFVLAADFDINYMQADSTMGADLRAALLTRATVIGHLNRYGDTSTGDANAEFLQAIRAYAVANPGEDGNARYYYALFLAQTGGAGNKAQISSVLAPIGTPTYANSSVRGLLQNARSISFYRQFPVLIAKIDPDFKAYLMSLGWTAADFSS